MAKIGDIYKTGDFLTAEDLQGKLLTDVITKADVQQLGDQTKIVLSFEHTDKLLVLNATNAKTLVRLYNSDDTDTWIGETIILRPDVTQFGGKQVGCIRVDVVAMGGLFSEAPEAEAEMEAVA